MDCRYSNGASRLRSLLTERFLSVLLVSSGPLSPLPSTPDSQNTHWLSLFFNRYTPVTPESSRVHSAPKPAPLLSQARQDPVCHHHRCRWDRPLSGPTVEWESERRHLPSHLPHPGLPQPLFPPRFPWSENRSNRAFADQCPADQSPVRALTTADPEIPPGPSSLISQSASLQTRPLRLPLLTWPSETQRAFRSCRAGPGAPKQYMTASAKEKRGRRMGSDGFGPYPSLHPDAWRARCGQRAGSRAAVAAGGLVAGGGTRGAA